MPLTPEELAKAATRFGKAVDAVIELTFAERRPFVIVVLDSDQDKPPSLVSNIETAQVPTVLREAAELQANTLSQSGIVVPPAGGGKIRGAPGVNGCTRNSWCVLSATHNGVCKVK